MTFREFLNEQMGTYAAFKFSKESNDYLIDLINELNVPNPIDKKELHCTLLYSPKYLPDYEPLSSIEESAKPIGLKVFEGDSRVLVLLLDCDFAKNRHKELMEEHDAEYPYDEYVPHITLSYDVQDLNVSDLPKVKLNKNIMIVKEYKEDLKEDYA